MNNRDLQSLAAVVQHLEKHEEFREIKEVELGVGRNKQKVVTINGTIITAFDETGKPLMPPTEAEKFKTILKEGLNLQDSDSVNTQASEHYHLRTVLIQATLGNERRLVKVLLDHGADPSVADSDGNNAFMHAAKSGYSDLLKDFMSLIHHEDNKQSAQDKKTQEEEQKENAPKEALAPSSQKNEIQTTEAAPKQARQQSDLSSLRIRLDPAVLEHKNKLGETAELLGQQYKEKFTLREEVAEEKNPNAKPKALSEKEPKKPKNSVDRFKSLIEDLQVLNPDKVLSEKPKETETITALAKPRVEPRSAASEAAELIATNRVHEERMSHTRHLYDGFYLKKLGFFSVKSRKLAAQNEAQINAALERAALRRKNGLILFAATRELELEELQQLSQANNYEPVLIKFGNQFSTYGCSTSGWGISPVEDWQLELLKENKPLLARFKTIQADHSLLIEADDLLLTGDPILNPKPSLPAIIRMGHKPELNMLKNHHYKIEQRNEQPILPISYQDQAKVRSALSLLKDYYAPESAPLPHFLQWNGLRRLLTFHLGRRYCTKAEKLYQGLEADALLQVDDAMQIYKKVETELHAVRELEHDKTSKNTIFNSSYTRRLYYILETLKKTEAYEQATYKLPVDTYLDLLDIKYGDPRQAEKEPLSHRTPTLF